ncbi:hypothetical protein ABZ858_12935 [Streptomyces sp. NPDC047017]|uniref:hypothetical protein n=1 Tax=Streptomyces sp. NPDC047017 TaxID=3155024 RepID=UPI0033D6462C
MRERSDSGEVPSTGEEVRRKRLDLSVAQVAGSAVAAVVAAKLASYFGVYGTILGAGVVSVVATCGGSVFQHFFRRTGEQIRTVTIPARPSPAGVPGERQGAPGHGEFTEGTVYRARVKSWKRPAVAAALVFGVTMAGITVYEAVSGSSFSGGQGTTVGKAVTGHRATPPRSGDDTPKPSTSPADGPGSGDGTSGTSPSGAPSGGPDRGTTVSPTPGASTGGGQEDPGGAAGDGTTPGSTAGDGGTTPEPGASATDPAPSASSRSGTGGPGPAGSAAP